MKASKLILVGLVALSCMCLIALIIHLASGRGADEHLQCKLQSAMPLTSSHQLRAFKTKKRDVLVRFSGFVEYFEEPTAKQALGNNNTNNSNDTTPKRTISALIAATESFVNATNQLANLTSNVSPMSHSINATTTTTQSPQSTQPTQSKYVALQLESVKSETHSDKNGKHHSDHSMLMTRIKLHTSCAKLSFDMMSRSSDNKQFAINNKIKLYRYKQQELECKLDNVSHDELLFQTDTSQHYYCPDKTTYNCTKLEDDKKIVAKLHITHIELEWNRPEKMKGDEFFTRQTFSHIPLIDPIKLGGPNYLHLSVAQVVELHGYRAKTYDAISVDGYITTVTRVINPEADQSTISRTVVFHHGITQNILSPQMSLCTYTRPQKPVNTTQFLRNYDKRFTGQNGQLPIIDPLTIGAAGLYGELSSLFNISNVIDNGNPYTLTCLPFHLSNNNYDVWLFEARASTPAATRHVNPSITVEEYFNFNLHDEATKDVPAQIAKVKEISGRDKVSYIAFSQSTSFMFILLSEQPEFKENLMAFVALSPVAFCSETKGALRAFWDVITPMPGFVTNNLNIPFPFVYEDAQTLNNILMQVCEEEEVAATVCREAVNSIVGPDENQNVLNIPFFSRLTSQTSYKAIIHMGQWTKKGTFNKFDYKEPHLNLLHYGQIEAPNYNVSRISFDKIILVRSPQNDYLSAAPDHEELKSRLRVPLYRDIVTPPSYNHYSFLTGASSYWHVIIPVTRALEQIYMSQ